MNKEDFYIPKEKLQEHISNWGRTGEGMTRGKSELTRAYVKQLKAIDKKKYGRRKLFILTCAIFSQGTGRTLAVEKLRTFEKLLEKNFKKTKKFKNKSARF